MIEVRDALAADAEVIAAINADGWRTNYVGLMPASRLARVEPLPDRWSSVIARAPRPWHVSVAVTSAEVIGFLTFLPMRSESLSIEGYDGEISALYVAPERQRTGVERARFERVRCAAATDGWAGLGVWTLAGSTQSCGFYAALGGRPIGTRTDLIDDIPVPGVGFGWRLHHRATALKE